MSACATTEFGSWDYPPLAPLVPLGVDVFSLCGIAATYLLRHAPKRVRFYAWSVFLVPSGLSILGNLAHADAKHLPDSGRVGAAVAPVLLALSAHLVIVARRWAFGDSDHTPADDTATLSADTASKQASTAETLSPDDEPRQPERRPHNATPDDVKTRALAALLAGATYEEAAAEVGRSVRAVQRWHDEYATDVKTRSRRARTNRRSAQRPSVEPDSAVSASSGVAVDTPDAGAAPTEPVDPRQQAPELVDTNA